MSRLGHFILLTLVLLLASCTNPEAKTDHSLKLIKLGSGTAIVTSTPQGIDCGKTCEHIFPYGELVELNIKVAKSSMFVSWGGSCFGSGDCKLSMKQEKEVRANIINLVCTEPPKITDKNLANLIKQTLHKNGNLSCADLAKLTTLEDESNEPGTEIRDLEGLQFAINLKLLKLPHNNISNISALANLSKLDKIDLDYNAISDLSAVENIPKLRVLQVTNNKIVKLSPLINLKNLEGLDLNSNMISDISALVQNKYLTGEKLILDLMGNCLDITGGSDLANLKILQDRKIKLYYQPQGSCGRQ